VKFAAVEPVVMSVAPALEQMVKAVPAFAVAALVIDNTLVDVTSAHAPPFALNVIVTLPAFISSMLGVYVAVVNDVTLVKVPVPLDSQLTLIALVALEPVVIFTAPVLSQIVKSLPATLVGGGDTVMVLVADTGRQFPVTLVVSVNVTVPVKLAAGVYVTVEGVGV
jgi:hypothetical protein